MIAISNRAMSKYWSNTAKSPKFLVVVGGGWLAGARF